MGFTFEFLFTRYASKSETQKWKNWEIIQKKENFKWGSIFGFTILNTTFKKKYFKLIYMLP